MTITSDIVKKEITIQVGDSLAKVYKNQESLLDDFPDLTSEWKDLEESIKNSSLNDDQKLQNKLNEAKYLLQSTEFKFNADYDLKDTPEWIELKVKRQEAREFIRANNG